MSTNQYSWVTDPDVPWDWGEDTWLVEVLKASPLLSTIKLVEAYKWKSGSYISQISTLFPSIMGVKVAPFHVMTDLLLLGRQTTCVIQSSKSNVICSIEIGGYTIHTHRRSHDNHTIPQ